MTSHHLSVFLIIILSFLLAVVGGGMSVVGEVEAVKQE
jgi:hypothetical protein